MTSFLRWVGGSEGGWGSREGDAGVGAVVEDDDTEYCTAEQQRVSFGDHI